MLQRLLGSLIAAPYELSFFSIWVVASLVRPVILVTALFVLARPKAALRKLELFTSTLQYITLCNDKKWKKPPDTTTFFDNATETITSKKIIFVRHGESTWNDTFNKGDRSTVSFIINFLPNLVYSVFMEWWFWISGESTESWFYDAPLSEKGRGQAEGIYKFLQNEHFTPKEQEYVTFLKNSDQSHVLSSNLRRAIATIGIGLRDRLRTDPLQIAASLQEISRNPDALSITPPHGTVVAAWTDPYYLEDVYKICDTTKHTGNKPVKSNGLVRIQQFAKDSFEYPKDCVIAAGHSLWFRSFFQTYLPHSASHVCKKKKLVNGGVVGFTLLKIHRDGKDHFKIDPSSITVLHGGF